MAVAVPYKAIDAISTSKDPRRAILELVGDLSGVEVMGDRVLVGVYVRPERTAGGIIRPDINKEEDVWQGKVGLVLKWGPNAFRDPTDGTLYEQRVEVGEWGVFHVGDARQLNLGSMPCRVIKDVNFVLKVDNPEIVF